MALIQPAMFSNPFIADNLSDVFEAYGKQHPDVSIHILSGEDWELCEELEMHRLDMILVRWLSIGIPTLQELTE